MALTFYPHTDDTQKGSLEQRIDILMDAAERYKAVVLDLKNNDLSAKENKEKEREREGVAKPELRMVDDNGSKRVVPRDQQASYNWEEIARVLREIRELPEASKVDRTTKAGFLTKLAEVYEILRAAKMAKLEAVRLALMGEANQLQGSGGSNFQVA